MDKHEKLLQIMLQGRSDANIPFTGLCHLMRRLGFEERIRGDHHIFTLTEVEEILNLQPKGSKVKPYQVKGTERYLALPSKQRRLIMRSKYEIIIYWSNEDEAYLAEVPELPGCMADGKTYREALSNAERIIREWIETAKELGRTIPEPKGRLKEGEIGTVLFNLNHKHYNNRTVPINLYV